MTNPLVSRRLVALALVACCALLPACEGETEVGGAGTGGSGDGGAQDGGANGADGPRVALRVVARADAIVRDTNLLRVSVPLETSLAVASDTSKWTIQHAGVPLVSADGTLFVFPAIEDTSRAGAAVWLFERSGAAGDTIEVSLDGSVLLDGVIGAPEKLGVVEVTPVIVRTPSGEGPVASNQAIAQKMKDFAPVLMGSCTIDLEVRAPTEVLVSGFGQLQKSDFVPVDDQEIIDVLRDATGEDVGVVFSQRLKPLYEAVNQAASADSRVVRALVFQQHQSSEAANAIIPAFFHIDVLASQFGISPYYAGPTLAYYWFDPDQSLAEQTLVRLSEEERDATYAAYFGEDHLEAFAHELGHLLGLPHPLHSTVIDSADGPSGANLMSETDECLPGCAPRISAHQCEIMLLGMTNFITPL